MELKTLTLVALLGALSAVGCSQTVRGSGPLTKESRQVGAFHGIRVGGAFQVTVKRGSKTSVTIEAQKSLLSRITTRIDAGQLIIETRGSMSTDQPFRAYITTPNLDAIDVNGAVHLKSDPMSASQISVSASGASEVNWTIRTKSLTAGLSGASQVQLFGSTDTLNAKLSGASQLMAGRLIANSVKIDASGASQANVHAEHTLKAEASGGSQIRYSGKPVLVHKAATGGSSINAG